MKFDAWGLRKNVSTLTRKKRRPSSTELQASKRACKSHPIASSLDIDSSPSRHERAGNSIEAHSSGSSNTNATSYFDVSVHELLVRHDCTLPDGSMKVDKLVELLSLPSYSVLREFHFLEILLLKWEQDGEYLRTALQRVQGDVRGMVLLKWNVFKTIDERLGPGEKNELTKACLRRMIEEIGSASESHFCWQFMLKSWLSSLWDIIEAPLWQTKKSMLNNDNLKAEVMGSSFVLCALTVFAEDHLSWLMEFLEEKLNKGVEFGDEEMALQYDFMEIVDEFSDVSSELDLNPSYYKFALKMSKENTEYQIKEVERVSAKLKKTREDYEELEEECVDLRRRVSDGGGRAEETFEISDPASHSEKEHSERLLFPLLIEKRA